MKAVVPIIDAKLSELADRTLSSSRAEIGAWMGRSVVVCPANCRLSEATLCYKPPENVAQSAQQELILIEHCQRDDGNDLTWPCHRCQRHRTAANSDVVFQKHVLLGETRHDQGCSLGVAHPQAFLRFWRTVPVPQACLMSQVLRMSSTASCSLRSVNFSPAITIAMAA